MNVKFLNFLPSMPYVYFYLKPEAVKILAGASKREGH